MMGAKPCPFCGDDVVTTEEVVVKGKTYHYIFCVHCGCSGPEARTPRKAWKLWCCRSNLTPFPCPNPSVN